MNVYEKYSKSRLKDNILDPLDVFEQTHKETSELRLDQVSRVVSTARKLFEMLNESELSTADKATALSVLNVLQNRIGNQ